MPDAVLSTHPETDRSIGNRLAHHWFETFLVINSLWVWLPFPAPILMHIGWNEVGNIIYIIYSFFCHQLPERSFFLFGQRPMYSLTEIQSVWQNTINPLSLRKFIGNQSMGWNVAW